jgi:hypothetical protein
MRRVCIEKCECLANPLFGSDVSQRTSWLWQGRDGHVLPLTRATEGVALKSSRLTGCKKSDPHGHSAMRREVQTAAMG